jgi:hypothetical protein
MIAAFGRAILCFGRTAALKSGRCCFHRTWRSEFAAPGRNEIWTEGPVEPNADDSAADQEAAPGAAAP